MEDEFKDYRENLEDAKKIKEALNLESIDTAILLMVQLDIDQLRFYNTK